MLLKKKINNRAAFLEEMIAVAPKVLIPVVNKRQIVQKVRGKQLIIKLIAPVMLNTAILIFQFKLNSIQGRVNIEDLRKRIE